MSTLYKVANYYAAKIKKETDNKLIVDVIERYKKASLDQFTSELMKVLYKVRPNIDMSIKLSEIRYNLLKYAGNEKSDAIIQYLKYRKNKYLPQLEEEYEDLDEQIAFLLNRYNENKGKQDVSEDSILLNDMKKEHGVIGATIERELRWQEEEFNRMLATRIKQLKVEEPLTGLSDEEYQEKVKGWLENYSVGTFQVYQPKKKDEDENNFDAFRTKQPSKPVPMTDPNVLPKYKPSKPVNSYENECPKCGGTSYESIGPGKERICQECGFYGVS